MTFADQVSPPSFHAIPTRVTERIRVDVELRPPLYFDAEDRLSVAREIQKNAWDFVPAVYLGQWTQPAAWRSNVKGIIGVPEVIPFWNIEKT